MSKPKSDNFKWKLLVAVVYDVLDFAVVIPNAATGGLAGGLFDVIGGALGYSMFGYIGLLNFWELADPTNTIELFPTMTATALLYKYGGLDNHALMKIFNGKKK